MAVIVFQQGGSALANFEATDFGVSGPLGRPHFNYFGVSGPLGRPQFHKSCACFRLISAHTIMVWKVPQKPKTYCNNKLLQSHLSPLFLLLGRERCGDRMPTTSKMITDRHSFWGQITPITDTDSCCPKKKSFPLQRQICGNVCRKSLITDTDSPLKSGSLPLQIQTSGSKRINSATISATTVVCFQAHLLTQEGGGVVAPWLGGYGQGPQHAQELREIPDRTQFRWPP